MQNREVFLALLVSGLWKQDVRLSQYGEIDFSPILLMAQEQSVVGVITAGLDCVADIKVPYEARLMFVGSTSQMEQQNVAMNRFVAALTEKLRWAGIDALLVKGQGLAQCYERPLWRSCGDVDLLLDEVNYENAKEMLIPLASHVEPEGQYKKHLAMTIDHWTVELHGNIRCGLSAKMDKELDAIQRDMFDKSDSRNWMNGEAQVSLPDADSDALLVFTHFIKHFYIGGLGLKQVCDWCRLLWAYRDEIDKYLIEERLKNMGLMSEWKAFGAFAVDYLGMPSEAMPLYSADTTWSRKARLICDLIMAGDRYKDNQVGRKSYLARKIRSFGHRWSSLARNAKVFPCDSLRFFPLIVRNGLQSAARGE